MRKLNAILSMGVLVLFIVHAVAGGFQLAGVFRGGSQLMKILAWIMTGLIALHTLIGIKLTADTLITARRSGASYFKENKLFWLRRISGFAIMVFIAFHILIFMGSSDGAFRLKLFESAQLISQLLLVASIAVHVLSNIRPLMISLGIKGFREAFIDLLLILSIILAFTGAAFVIYYLRWNVF